jgi:hypothetical protein
MKARWLKPDSDWTWSGKSMRRKEVLGQGSEDPHWCSANLQLSIEKHKPSCAKKKLFLVGTL